MDLGTWVVGYLAIGSIIMYYYLNDRVTYRLSSIVALLLCIMFWLPILVKFAVKHLLKSKK